MRVFLYGRSGMSGLHHLLNAIILMVQKNLMKLQVRNISFHREFDANTDHFLKDLV